MQVYHNKYKHYLVDKPRQQATLRGVEEMPT